MRKFKFNIRGNQYNVELMNFENNIAKIEVNGTKYEVEVEKEIKTSKTPTLVRKKVVVKNGGQQKSSGSTKISAPLPGTIINIKVAVGDEVKKGDCLLIMEAMKMENNVLAEKDGTISKITVGAGDSVLQGDTLIEMN
jgi:biotin carboxyl carrier protein